MNLPDFRFSEIATEEIGFKKANCSILIEQALNKNIKISHYTSNIKTIACFYIMVKPDNSFHKPYKRFLSQKKMVRWFLRLDYQQLLLANLEEVTSIMAIAYLEAIETYFKNFKHDFDGKRFHKEVKQLFEEQGWLVETPISV